MDKTIIFRIAEYPKKIIYAIFWLFVKDINNSNKYLITEKSVNPYCVVQ